MTFYCWLSIFSSHKFAPTKPACPAVSRKPFDFGSTHASAYGAVDGHSPSKNF